MPTVIIVDDGCNDSLLRFTQTKLFFNANNVYRNWINDCITVDSYATATKLAPEINTDIVFIIKTGLFLTSTFQKLHAKSTGVIVVDENDKWVIKYHPDTYIGFKKRCNYPPGSKQLYIVENMLRSILAAKKSVYLENTETNECVVNTSTIRHLVGLASGWKTIYLAKKIGLKNLESVTVYDVNPIQLEHAKYLHNSYPIPSSLEKEYKNKFGEYKVPEWINQEFWQEWYNYPIQFSCINLFDVPVFSQNSLVWVSNSFEFEPTLFEFGWEYVQTKKQELIYANKDSIVITH